MNSLVLVRELEWFYQVLDARIRFQFGDEPNIPGVEEIDPPSLGSDSAYGALVNRHGFGFAERLVLILSLVPHLRPQLLDTFFARSEDGDRRFTEFGGRTGSNCPGFLPTGETALFILAGDDLGRRLVYCRLFSPDHAFSKHGLLGLDGAGPCDPPLSGYLRPSSDLVALVTTGQVAQIPFSLDFPAARISSGLEWDELVLDPFTLEQVLEIKAWIQHGNTLLHELGLGRKLRPGFRSLFHGQAGTGKTATAATLGKVTGLDVYRIDLSAVISKYIGETEKNLEKVFRKAEHGEWILFFDEADALFGKRTSIGDAHDRYANQEISYLLQRLEDYPGVVILASNFRANLDEAFTRRFQSIIHFPMPRASERCRLWRNGFSEQTPLAPDLRPEDLGARFELSGGSIMNVVRHATLMALRRGTRTITMEDVEQGIRKELQKEGKTS